MIILPLNESPSAEPLAPSGLRPPGANGSAATCFSDPEVKAKDDKRRYFTAFYKLKILSEADHLKHLNHLK